MTEPQIIQAEKPQRDALIIYAFLGRLGKKCTKNEVLEAVSSSARDNKIDWAQDAVSGFGFLCNGGYTKISNITPAITPALAVGKNGQLAIIEKVKKTAFPCTRAQAGSSVTSPVRNSRIGIRAS